MVLKKLRLVYFHPFLKNSWIPSGYASYWGTLTRITIVSAKIFHDSLKSRRRAFVLFVENIALYMYLT